MTMPIKQGRHWIKRKILDRLLVDPENAPRVADERERSVAEEEKSREELAKLNRVIEERKQIARDTDVSYHLWGLYKSHFQGTQAQPLHPAAQDGGWDGEWYDIKIFKVSTRNGLNEYAFELKGEKYRFVDDEEKQGWRENIKFFSLFLYDAAGRCLIEIPMKMRVDSSGRDYSVMSDGPRAFLPGRWTHDFINVRLKHQSMLNQEIRSQKHQERLREIEDLKKRFGIED